MRLLRKVAGAVLVVGLAAVAVTVALRTTDGGPEAEPGEDRRPVGVQDLAGARPLGISAEYRIAGPTNPYAGVAIAARAVIDDRGHLFLLQPMDLDIKVFDGQGRLVRTIGREGEGPGEFRALSAIGLVGDTLHVSDPVRGTVSFFDLDGNFVTSRRWLSTMAPEPVDREIMMTPTTPLVVLFDGTAVMRPNVVGLAQPPGLGLQTASVRIPLLRIDAAGQVTDTVAWEELTGTVVGMMHQGQPVHIRAPFVTGPLTFALPDGSGIVTVNEIRGDGASILVTKVESSGETEFRRFLPIEPRPMTDGILRLAAQRVRSRFADEAPPIPDIEAALAGAGLVPGTLPAVTALVGGSDGSIWLRREEIDGASVLWNVLDSEGFVRGSVLLPRTQKVLAARGDLMVAVDEDDIGNMSLVDYRLR